MAEVKLGADSGGGSLSLKGPSSASGNTDFLDASGNVAIPGTQDVSSAERGKLDIYHTSTNDGINSPHIRLWGPANNDARIEFGTATNTGEGGYIMYNDGDEGLYIGSRMATYAEVNICIGMNDGDPTTNKKFTVNSEGALGRGCAHAYGRIDGQSTPSIERDFGCGSITDVSAGRYNVGLTNALADNEHMIGFINCHPINTGSQIFGFGEIYQNSTTLIELHMRRCDNDAPSVSTDDWDNIAFVIFDVS